MKPIPDIEVNADKLGTLIVGFFFVMLLIRLPLQIAYWVEGKIIVSPHAGWESYMVTALAVYTAVRSKDKGIKIISVLFACTQGARIALHLANASAASWRLAGQGLGFGELVLDIGVLIGIAIWFKNRVRIVKAPHNA